MLIAIIATLAFAILVNVSFLARSAIAQGAKPTLEAVGPVGPSRPTIGEHLLQARRTLRDA